MANNGRLETNYAYGVNDKWYLRCDWNVKEQSIANNYTTINWTVSLITEGSSSWVMCNDINLSIGGTTYNIIGGRQRVNKGTLKSGTHIIYHNTKGEGSMWLAIDGAIYKSSKNASASKTYYLPNIPRGANITSVANITDEQNPTIYYNSPLGSSVTSLRACMTYYDENTNVVAMYRDIPTTGNNYTFNLTAKERELLRSQCDSRTKTIYYYIETVINGQRFTNYKSAQVTIVNAKPTITCNAYDSNTKTVSLTGDNKKIIKGYSDLVISMTSTAYKNATIKRNSIFYNNSWHEGQTNVTWNDATNNDIQCWTIDSRGWETYEYPKLTLIDYYKPQCSITLGKPSADGSIDFTIHGNYWKGNFGKADNALNVQYIVREEGISAVTDTWEKVIVTPTNNKFDTLVHVTNLDYRKTYSIQVWIGDSVSEAYSSKLSFSCRPLFDWGKEDFNFNVPISIKGTNIFELIYPVGSIYTSVNNVNPSTLFGGTWERFGNGRTLMGVDETQNGFKLPEYEGGERYHKLTVDEMPAHTHSIGNNRDNYSVGMWKTKDYIWGNGVNSVNDGAYGHGADTSIGDYLYAREQGGGKAHNNLPPYITVYFWQRTA